MIYYIVSHRIASHRIVSRRQYTTQRNAKINIKKKGGGGEGGKINEGSLLEPNGEREFFSSLSNQQKEKKDV